MFDPWVFVVALLPAALPAYFALIFILNGSVVGIDTTELWAYEDWLYAPFIFFIGGIYLLTEGIGSGHVEPVYVLALPIGIALYGGTQYGWVAYTNTVPKRGRRTIFELTPGLLVPIPEELLFREGLAVLADTYGPLVYVVASSVIFGLYHYHLGRHEVIFKTGLGIVLALVYLATGSILVPILLHFGYNLAWVVYVTDPLS